MQGVSVPRRNRTRRSLALVALLATVAALLAAAAAVWMSQATPERATQGAPRINQARSTSRFADVLQANQHSHLDSTQQSVAAQRSGSSRLAFMESLPGEAQVGAAARRGVGFTESEPGAPPASTVGSDAGLRTGACRAFDPHRACIQP